MNKLSRSVHSILATLAIAILASGCATTLVADVLPIPVVAFFTPHVDLNDIKADDYLKKCGDSSHLVNRRVEVSRAGCVPAGLTRIITLGIWQWCPATVSYEADVKNQ